MFSFHIRWLDALCPAIAFSETLWMLLPECRLCYLNKTGLYAFCVSFQESLFGVQTTGEVMKIQITYETRVLLDTLGGFYCVPRWQDHCLNQFSCILYYLTLLWVSLSHLPHFSPDQSLHKSDNLTKLRWVMDSDNPSLPRLSEFTHFFSDHLSSSNFNSRHRHGWQSELPPRKKVFCWSIFWFL